MSICVYAMNMIMLLFDDNKNKMARKPEKIKRKIRYGSPQIVKDEKEI